MKLTTFQTASDFYQTAGGWLGRDEGVNSVAIGVTKNLMSDKPSYKEAYFGAVTNGDEVLGTAIMTPPHPLNINGMSLAVVPYFVEMAKKIVNPNSVLGPGEIAKEFAKIWCDEAGCSLGEEEAQAIHKLERVNHPKSCGSIIIADESHQKLLEEWSREFCIDCGMTENIPDLRAQVASVIENRSRYLLVVNGQTVSMAGRARETETGGTINYVYTPKNLRSNGFASELVAKLSQEILDSGKKAVFLYTQLDNPTSNKIYKSLEFRVISDSWHIRFCY
jgi:ribosomal protein S18 acetylase RimI-like enzyme